MWLWLLCRHQLRTVAVVVARRAEKRHGQQAGVGPVRDPAIPAAGVAERPEAQRLDGVGVGAGRLAGLWRQEAGGLQFKHRFGPLQHTCTRMHARIFSVTLPHPTPFMLPYIRITSPLA